MHLRRNCVWLLGWISCVQYISCPLFVSSTRGQRAIRRHHALHQRDTPSEEREAAPHPTPTPPVSGGVTLNIFSGPEEEVEEIEAPPQPAAAPEIGKLASTVGRLERGAEEEARHETDVDTMKTAQEESAMRSDVQDIAHNLQSKAEEERQEAAQIDAQTKAERERERVASETEGVEKDTLVAQGQQRVDSLHKRIRDTELTMKGEEELIHEDEDEIQQDKAQSDAQLAAIQQDEEEKLGRINELARLRGKEAKELTVQDCFDLLNANQTRAAPPPEKEEAKIKKEVAMEKCEDPCAEEPKVGAAAAAAQPPALLSSALNTPPPPVTAAARNITAGVSMEHCRPLQGLAAEGKEQEPREARPCEALEGPRPYPTALLEIKKRRSKQLLKPHQLHHRSN